MYLKVIRNFLIRSFFYSNAKKHKKTKNQDKFWSDSRFLNWEILNYFNKIKNSLFFNLLPKLYQTMKLKPNQTLFYRTYLNLTLFSLVKKIKIIHWLSKSKFLSFMNKRNPSNGGQTFFHGTYSNLTSKFEISQFYD